VEGSRLKRFAWFRHKRELHFVITCTRTASVLIARGRDAVDVPIGSTFSPNTLKGFKVWAHEEDMAPAVQT
jgi:hypothetical protein